MEAYATYATAYLDMSSETPQKAKRFGDSTGGAIIADSDANKKASGSLVTSGGAATAATAIGATRVTAAAPNQGKYEVGNGVFCLIRTPHSR